MISKINIYADSMNPEDGGIQNTAFEIFNCMSKEYEVHGLSKILPLKYKDRRITEVKSVTRIGTAKWLLRYSDRNTCNIVMNCWMGVPALFIRIICGTHYFVMAHGNDVYEFTHGKKSMKRYMWSYINKSILKNADFIVCNSEYTKQLVEKVIPFAKISVIHPPCGSYFTGEAHDISKHSIFSIGRLEQRKGFQFVLEAVKLLIKEFPDIHYYLAGDGAYKSKLESIVREHYLENHVTFLGRVDDKIKVKYFSTCEIFAMPSIEVENNYSVEGFGIVYLEANQFGKYVIAGNTGGIKDAVKNKVTGVLLDEVSPENIALELKEVFNHHDYYYSDTMIKQRKQWAAEHSIEKTVDRYYQVMADAGLR